MCRLPLAWLLGVAAVVAAPAGGLTWSADLPAAGDGRHLWLAAPAAALPGDDAGPAVELLHADGRDDDPAWEPVTRLRGRLAALVAPAAGPGGPNTTDRLWMVFDGGAVVRVSLTPGALEDQWFFSTRPVANLPASLEVLDAAAAGDALWVVGRTADASVLAGLDAGAATGETGAATDTVDNAELLNLVLRLPRPLGTADKQPAPTEPDGEPQEPLQQPAAEPAAALGVGVTTRAWWPRWCRPPPMPRTRGPPASARSGSVARPRLSPPRPHPAADGNATNWSPWPPARCAGCGWTDSWSWCGRSR